MRKGRVAASIAAMLFALGASSVSAQEAQPPRFQAQAPSIGSSEMTRAAVYANNKKLQSTSFSSGRNTSTFGAGYAPLDSVRTITCPGTTGTCILQVIQTANVRGTTASNRWALCTAVDGVVISDSISTTCPYLGFVTNSPTYYIGATSSQTKFAIPVGDHTVRTYLYTEFGGTPGLFNITYNVFK
jgi:hypothetical protein